MISLASEMTDSKGRHARGWLFFDAECEFCTRTAAWLIPSMKRRGLAVAPLQDPRVGVLLGLSREQLRRTIRFVLADGTQHQGADAVFAVARELKWPVRWMSNTPGILPAARAVYRWLARRRRCPAQESLRCQTARRSAK
jgi:predicted DCC family thiol-disulfide oxidoreductase YuxK